MSGNAPPATMSAEVRGDNPYSRLMALQSMGIVKNYADIRNKSVAVIGVGGVGSVVAEMLTRCGIGKLLLYDYDKVELANMNRLFYRPEQRGLSKVDAAKASLQGINPDVNIFVGNYNIAAECEYDRFVQELSHGSIDGKGKVDVLLCCVDNFTARVTINHVCLEENIIWMESGVSENAVSGHIQLLIPGVTPCYQCCPPLVVASGVAEVKRLGVCAASLPTTMSIVAGFLTQNTLKYLLGFGTVSEYVGYDALLDHFPSITIKANPECTHARCVSRQKEYAAKVKELGERAHPLFREKEPPKAVVHAHNDWGITKEGGGSEGHNLNVGGGVEYAYQPPPRAEATSTAERSGQETSLQELMAKLKSVS